MNRVSIESLLPVLGSLTAVLALLWAIFWLVNWGWQRLRSDGLHGVGSSWLGRLSLFLRRATGVSLLAMSLLIMLYGVGIRGVPRMGWDEISGWMRGSGLPLLFILGSALVLIRAAGMLTRRLPDLLVHERMSFAERIDRRKRVETQGRLAFWTLTAIVVAIAAVMSLQTVGIDVAPLLAGGAIVSVALGFGAQNLVRDVIGGLFMILENQLRVGDIASINGKSGEVEAIHLRTTVLRGLDGTVHIIPNGGISELSNMTKNYSFYVIDLGIAYKESVDRVMEILHEIGGELRADPAYGAKILAPLEVFGVNEFAASAVVIKLRIMTVPLEQWAVGRELRRRIKNRFDAEGIALPFPHLSVYFGDAGRPEQAMDAPASSATP